MPYVVSVGEGCAGQGPEGLLVGGGSESSSVLGSDRSHKCVQFGVIQQAGPVSIKRYREVKEPPPGLAPTWGSREAKAVGWGGRQLALPPQVCGRGAPPPAWASGALC